MYLAEPGTGRQVTGVGGLAPGRRVRAVLADGAADLDVRAVREAAVRGNGNRDVLPLVTAESLETLNEPDGERSDL